MFFFAHLSWSAMLPVGLYLLIFLIFGLCSIPFLLVRRRPSEPPLSVSPAVARKHRALIYLIRSGDALLLLPFIFLISAICLGFLISINPFRSSAIHGLIFSLFMLSAILLLCACGIAKFRQRFPESARSFFRRVEDVTTANIANFAFIFSALAAYDFYHLMPAARGSTIGLTPFLNREFLCFIVFWVLWKYLKVLLTRLLEIDPLSSSPSSPPDDPDLPEFPQKSPLIPL